MKFRKKYEDEDDLNSIKLYQKGALSGFYLKIVQYLFSIIGVTVLIYSR